MKTLLFFGLLIVTVGYIVNFVNERGFITIIFDEKVEKFIDNTSKYITDFSDTTTAMAKDGYDSLAKNFYKDNGSDNTSSVDKKPENKADNRTISVTDNNTMLIAIDAMVNAVSDNITKTVKSFGEYINENFLQNDNSTATK